jgi:hypothetical protein
LEHLPYSPDFAPNDLWLFTKIKSALNEHRFKVIEDTQKMLTKALQAIPRQKFQKHF